MLREWGFYGASCFLKLSQLAKCHHLLCACNEYMVSVMLFSILYVGEVA